MRKLLLLGVALGTFASAGEILTNSPAWNGTENVTYWGSGGFISTPTYGETVTVPTDGNNILSSFTFYISEDVFAATFRAYVQAWNGSTVTGTPLYTSPSSFTSTGLTPAYDAYTFSPNATLTPGGVYLLYFSTIGVINPLPIVSAWGATSADTYSGGSFWYSEQDVATSDVGVIGDLNTGSWAQIGVTDLAFSATFTSTPEPASLGLVLTGLGAMLWRAKRRG